MDRQDALNKRADLVEERTTAYVHRAKRMVLDVFGLESTSDQSLIVVELATAMIQLEAAELNAASLRRVAKALEGKDES